MMKMTFTVLLSSIAIACCSAQQIEIKNSFWGLRFYQFDKSLNISEVSQVLSANPDATAYFKKAKSSNVVASILAGAGGALIGFPVSTAIAGGDPNWTLAAIGAGLAVVAIPISSSTVKNAQQAVDTYNQDISYLQPSLPSFQLLAQNGGVVLSVSF